MGILQSSRDERIRAFSIMLAIWNTTKEIAIAFILIGFIFGFLLGMIIGVIL